MWTFDWSEFITEDLRASLGSLITDPLAGELDDDLRRLFHHVGGLPLIAVRPDTASRTRIARQMLIEAVGHYEAGDPAPMTGHVLTESTSPGLEFALAELDPVDVNLADWRTLEKLPAIGAVAARAIVRERQDGGYYESLDELVERVKGVGPQTLRALAGATIFRYPSTSSDRPASGFDEVVARSFRRFSDAATADELRRWLGAVVSVAARDPHPATAEGRIRSFGGEPAPSTSDAALVGLLEDRSYYTRLPGFLRAAQESIVLAMFHVAFAGPDHPSRLLIDELVAAQERGVDVRVLLDRDRSTDPYMSLAINQAAKDHLDAHGVPCRFDAEDVLLHSKFLVIDGRISILGSHNWSAGSFFGFDDLSLVVESPDFAGYLTGRFDNLWPVG
jgi:hypothetical protein